MQHASSADHSSGSQGHAEIAEPVINVATELERVGVPGVVVPTSAVRTDDFNVSLSANECDVESESDMSSVFNGDVAAAADLEVEEEEDELNADQPSEDDWEEEGGWEDIEDEIDEQAAGRKGSAAWRRVREDWPLYTESKESCGLSSLEATFTLMEWRMRHKVKTLAMEELLRLLAEVLLPRGNLCPPSLYHARKLIRCAAVHPAFCNPVSLQMSTVDPPTLYELLHISEH
jgi:hypothetical protein